MANWDYQKKMDILRIVDCSVTLREKPWRERFEKYRKRWNFRDFWWFFTNSGGCRSGCGLEIWTYIIFGSISMSETQNFKNIGWSHGLQGRKSESTTPHLRGCVLELACRRSDRPGRSRNLGNRKSARMQERRASRCAAFFGGVASIGDATMGTFLNEIVSKWQKLRIRRRGISRRPWWGAELKRCAKSIILFRFANFRLLDGDPYRLSREIL